MGRKRRTGVNMHIPFGKGKKARQRARKQEAFRLPLLQRWRKTLTDRPKGRPRNPLFDDQDLGWFRTHIPALSRKRVKKAKRGAKSRKRRGKK